MQQKAAQRHVRPFRTAKDYVQPWASLILFLHNAREREIEREREREREIDRDR